MHKYFYEYLYLYIIFALTDLIWKQYLNEFYLLPRMFTIIFFKTGAMQSPMDTYNVMHNMLCS